MVMNPQDMPTWDEMQRDAAPDELEQAQMECAHWKQRAKAAETNLKTANAERRDLSAMLSNAKIELSAAEAEVARLRKALKFYADRETWKGDFLERPIDKDCDGDFVAVQGKRARQALAHQEQDNE